MRQQPARTLGNRKNHTEKYDGWHHRKAEHESPCLLCGQPISHEVCERDPECQRELVETDQHSARLWRSKFRDINGRGDRGKSDPDTDYCPCHNQNHNARRQGRKQRTDNEDTCRPNQGCSTANSIGNHPSYDRSNHRSDQHDADDKFLRQRR
jgi:hypothetical protein